MLRTLVTLGLLAATPLLAQMEYSWVLPLRGTAEGTDRNVAFDAAGHLYVAAEFRNQLTLGSFTLNSTGQSDIAVARLGRDGQTQWARSFGSPNMDMPHGIAVVGEAVYVCGFFSGAMSLDGVTLTSAGATDIFLVCLHAATGAVVWAVRAGSLGDDYAAAVATDPAGTYLYLAGQFQGSATFGATQLVSASGSADVFVSRIEPVTGQFLWTSRAGGPLSDGVLSLVSDASGTPYVGGYVRGTAEFPPLASVTAAGGSDGFVAALHPLNGQFLWRTLAGGAGDDRVRALALGPSSLLVAAGDFQQTLTLANPRTSAGEADAFVAALDTGTGQFLWDVAYGGVAADSARALAFDSTGALYVAGEYKTSLAFPGAGTTLVTSGFSARDTDIYLARLNPTTQLFEWATRAYGNAYDMPFGLALFSDTGALPVNHYAALVGYGENAMSFEGGVAHNAGQSTFLALASYPAPTLTSALTAGVAEGAAAGTFSYSITATHAPTGFSATGYPVGDWLSLNPTTGVLTNTAPVPLGDYPVTYPITLVATNTYGSATETLLLTVTDAAPVLTNTVLTHSATQGLNYQAPNAPILTVTATGSPTAFHDVDNVLAAHNLTLQADGTVRGIPGGGTYPTILPLRVTAQNASGTSAPLTFYVHLAPALPDPVLTSSLVVSAFQNQSFSYVITASNMPAPLVAGSFNAVGLPANLAVNTTSGLISGIPLDAGVYNITLSAHNGSVGSPVTANLVLTVSDPRPAITSPLTASAGVGLPFSYQITATNAPTGYSAAFLPSWLSLDPATGTLTGIPAATGTHALLITATNAHGSDNEMLTLTVTQPAPVLTSSLQATAPEGAAIGQFSYTITATHSPTSYAASGLPSWLSLNAATGQLTNHAAIPAGDYPVTWPITLTAQNAAGSDTRTLYLTVTESRPLLTSPTSAAAAAGQPFAFTLTASGLQTQLATDEFLATGLPLGLSLNGTTGLISGTPQVTGTWFVTVEARNAFGADIQTLTLSINQGAPVIHSPEVAEAVQGTPFSYTLTAANMPNLPLVAPASFAALGLPAGLTLNATTGLISGTPAVSGAFTVTLSATNAYGTDTRHLALHVQSVLPVIHSPTTAGGTPGTPFSYQILATHAPTSYAALGLPPGLTVNNATGFLTGTPLAEGTFAVTLFATNATGTGSAPLQLTLTGGTPVITSSLAATAFEGQYFSYTLTADNAPASFGAVGLPPGLTLDTATGALTGMVAPGQYGSVFPVTLTASNAFGSGVATLQLMVHDGAPAFTSAIHATGYQGVWFSHTLPVSGTPATFSATGLPPGLVVDAQHGLLTGTPTAAGTYVAQLSASNAYGATTTTGTFHIVDMKPEIFSALTVQWPVGQPDFSYSILATHTPTLYGASGLGAIGGLTFDTQTGLLSGTPANAGTFLIPLTATNAHGTDVKMLELRVNNTPRITSSLVAGGIGGTPAAPGPLFTYNITTSVPATLFAAEGLPPGLQIGSGTGLVSGNPTAFGVFHVILTAQNPPHADTATLVLHLNTGTPVITSPLSGVATEGSPFAYTMAADNAPTSFSATHLPPWLALNPVTGQITGTPPAGTYPATFVWEIAATNASGTDTRTYTLSVEDAAPRFTHEAVAAGFLGVPMTFNLTTDFAPANVSISQSGFLPAGLAFLAGPPAQLAGTPTEEGLFEITLQAEDISGNGFGIGTQTLRVVITNGVPAITSATTASAKEGQPFRYFAAASVSGASFALAYTSGGDGLGLPAWLSFNPTTGELWGTPPADDYDAGSLTWSNPLVLSLTAQNALGTSAPVALSLSIEDSRPDFAPGGAFNASAVEGQLFQFAVPFDNGPTSFALLGVVPAAPWLTLHTATGVLSGTPPGGTAGTTFTVSVQAANAWGVSATATGGVLPQEVAGGASSLAAPMAEPPPAFTVTVGSGAPVLLEPVVPVEVVEGAAVSLQLAAAYSPNEYTANFLPMGLHLDPATGSLYGQPLEYGAFVVTVFVRNAYGVTTLTQDIHVAQSSASASLPRQTSVAWLDFHGLGPDYALAEAADSDGDGIPNWLEYLAGTDPTDPDSRFAVQDLLPVPQGGSLRFDLTFPTVPQRRYRVEFSSDMQTWHVLEAGLVGSGGLLTVSDVPDIPTQGPVFYRVVAEPRHE